MPRDGKSAASRLSWPDPAVMWVAAGTCLTLLAVAGRYGPHRDELYFIAAGRHPQWGYPDQPPLAPLLARAVDDVAHGSLYVLRGVSALAIAVVVVLTADLARMLGAGPRARLLAAVVTATGPGVLAVGHLLSTSTIDLLVWTVLVRMSVSLFTYGPGPGWLLFGVTAGVGLENKTLPAFLITSLLVGAAVTGPVRAQLRSPWVLGGLGTAAIIWIPTLVWQAAHDWPQAVVAGDIRSQVWTPTGVASLVGFQLLLLGPAGGLLAATGLAAALHRSGWPGFRPVAVAYLVLLGAFAVTGGKHYYLLGLLPPLVAAGSVEVERHLTQPRLRQLTIACAAFALVPLPSAIPVLPATVYAGSVWESMNPDQLETIGWPVVASGVQAAATDLPTVDRADAIILTANYGQAGALLWYGAPLPVYSGHNGFADWGPPISGGPILFVGQEPPPADVLTGCHRTTDLDVGVDSEEARTAIWSCTGPSGPWQQAWPKLRHLSG